MQWFRWYHGTATDMKFGRIARQTGQTRERVLFVWAMLLESASDNDTRGTFDVEPDDIADILNCETDAIALIMDAMRDAGLVDGNTLVSWEKRQPARDDSAARQRKHRARNADVTRTPRDSDAPVTRVTVLDTETDTETETEKKGRARGARLTLDQPPADWIAWAEGEGHHDPPAEWLRFRDYWIAQPGQKGVKNDWPATWRNWIRRALDDKRSRKPTGNEHFRDFAHALRS